MTDLAGWLAEREPPAPREFLDWLEPVPSRSTSISEALGDAAAHHLAEALERLGRNREGALHLLAADALLTYACEAAAGEDDTERVLADLLGRIVPDVAGPTTPTGP